MPKFHTLAAAEIEEINRRRNNLEDLKPYMDFLGTLKPGDWFAVELVKDDHKRTVKRRTSIAGTALGQRIKWRRPVDGALIAVFGGNAR